MKKLFCVLMIMCFCVLLCPENIALAKTTLGQRLSGKSSSAAKNEPAKQSGNIQEVGKTSTFFGPGKRCRNLEMYCIDKNKDFPADYTASFNLSDLKNASPEFKKCVDNGNYKGLIEITAIPDFCSPAEEGCTVKVDKSSTCQRR